MQMTPSINDLADANLLESIREHARWQSPCELVEENGILMIAGATNFPGAYKNCVARIDRNVPAAELLERARDFFGSRQRGFTVFVRTSRDADLESLLQAEGFTQRSDSPCMLIEAPVSLPDLAGGIEVEHFAEQRHIRDASLINAEAYQALGLAPEETHAFFAHPSRLLARQVAGYVAYRGGLPLATALTIKSADGAGVYWVGTVTVAQRTGLATACTALATNAGFSHGATVVTLQASPYGEPVYRRLGYRTYDRLKWFRHLGGAKQ
jgi:hypothetical protein